MATRIDRPIFCDMKFEVLNLEFMRCYFGRESILNSIRAYAIAYRTRPYPQAPLPHFSPFWGIDKHSFRIRPQIQQPRHRTEGAFMSSIIAQLLPFRPA